jgi:hypothetical protein
LPFNPRLLQRGATVLVAGTLTLGLVAEMPADAQTQKARNQAIARTLVKQRHWSTTQFKCLVKLWNRESGWRTRAGHVSGSYGIPQALPGRKMRSSGKDWRTNPRTQIKWGLKYIKGRYGTPCRAWAHSQSHGWY